MSDHATQQFSSSHNGRQGGGVLHLCSSGTSIAVREYAAPAAHVNGIGSQPTPLRSPHRLSTYTFGLAATRPWRPVVLEARVVLFSLDEARNAQRAHSKRTISHSQSGHSLRGARIKPAGPET